MDVNDVDPTRTFITGFVVAGETPRRVLVRAAGPALSAFGVERALTDPSLRVSDATGRVVAENDDWRDSEAASAARSVGAFPLQPGTADAAALLVLPPGSYSMQVTANGGSGVALAEVFDATQGNTPGAVVTNVSTRGFVGAGEAQLTSGFVITGTTAKRVLIRASGPALTRFNVGNALADPTLVVHKSSTVVAQNDDWQTAPSAAAVTVLTDPEAVNAAARAVGAFAFPPNSKDSALLVELAPGAYTATVSGASGGTGVALLEVYEVAPLPPASGANN
jgi:hypothetical protein